MIKSIFVLDDDDFFLDLITEMASKEGHYIQTSTKAETSDIPVLSKFNILILDLYMPNLDGMAILDKLSSQPNKPDIILISAAETDIINLAKAKANKLNLNILGVLRKPFSIIEFKNILNFKSDFKKLSIG